MNALAALNASVWLGMVAAVSFLEAPWRFRAPRITSELGLGIGRLVFPTLNRVEVGLLTVAVLALVLGAPSVAMVWSTVAAGTVLGAS